MNERKTSYLESQLEASVKHEDYKTTITFQRTKIKLKDERELGVLQEVNPDFQKHIHDSEDEVTIVIERPKNYKSFKDLNEKNPLARSRFAYQLVKKVMEHPFRRLHLIISPDNIVFDGSLTPYFLHYGIKESIPPYEKDEERLFHELKAIVANVVVGQYTFEKYLKFSETLKLSPLAKSIIQAKDMDELLTIIEKEISRLEELEFKNVTVPRKKWTTQRYILFGLTILLIPALLYSIYTMFFTLPKQEAYVLSSEYFTRKKYSDVITTLEKYDPKDMPYIVQYQLVSSYIIHESLTEEQRENVQKMITLQTDPQYFLYWIYIGRGMNQEAIDIARSMEDRELIIYGLLKREEEIKADHSLSGEEKQKELTDIRNEIEAYQKEQEQLKEEQEKEENVTNQDTIESEKDETTPTDETSESDNGPSANKDENIEENTTP